MDALPHLVLHHLTQLGPWRWRPHYLDPVLACREDLATKRRGFMLAKSVPCQLQYLWRYLLRGYGHHTCVDALVDHLVRQYDLEGETGRHYRHEHGSLVSKCISPTSRHERVLIYLMIALVSFLSSRFLASLASEKPTLSIPFPSSSGALLRAQSPSSPPLFLYCDSCCRVTIGTSMSSTTTPPQESLPTSSPLPTVERYARQSQHTRHRGRALRMPSLRRIGAKTFRQYKKL